MLNLLPPAEKYFLQKEKNLKSLLILGLVLLFGLMCFSLMLLSINIYIAGQANAEDIVMKQVKEQAGKLGFADVEDKIRACNKSINDINSFYHNRIEMSGLIERISGILPSGIQLSYFSFSAVEETIKEESSGKAKKKIIREISISGFAPSRENLFELKQVLESQQDFSNVYFPASNWTKPKDIDFSLKFNL